MQYATYGVATTTTSDDRQPGCQEEWRFHILVTHLPITYLPLLFCIVWTNIRFEASFSLPSSQVPSIPEIELHLSIKATTFMSFAPIAFSKVSAWSWAAPPPKSLLSAPLWPFFPSVRPLFLRSYVSISLRRRRSGNSSVFLPRILRDYCSPMYELSDEALKSQSKNSGCRSGGGRRQRKWILYQRDGISCTVWEMYWGIWFGSIDFKSASEVSWGFSMLKTLHWSILDSQRVRNDGTFEDFTSMICRIEKAKFSNLLLKTEEHQPA